MVAEDVHVGCGCGWAVAVAVVWQNNVFAKKQMVLHKMAHNWEFIVGIISHRGVSSNFQCRQIESCLQL